MPPTKGSEHGPQSRERGGSAARETGRRRLFTRELTDTGCLRGASPALNSRGLPCQAEGPSGRNIFWLLWFVTLRVTTAEGRGRYVRVAGPRCRVGHGDHGGVAGAWAITAVTAGHGGHGSRLGGRGCRGWHGDHGPTTVADVVAVTLVGGHGSHGAVAITAVTAGRGGHGDGRGGCRVCRCGRPSVPARVATGLGVVRCVWCFRCCGAIGIGRAPTVRNRVGEWVRERVAPAGGPVPAAGGPAGAPRNIPIPL